MSMKINSNSYNYSNYNSNANSNKMDKAAKSMASGKKVNSAADDAATLAISDKLQALINGLDKGTSNSYDMKNLLQSAEGGMDTISDSLNRIRELGVQSKSGIYSEDDIRGMQYEANQLIDHINSTSSNTQFNNKNLLDGSYQNMNTASYADGSGVSVSINKFDANSLGIGGIRLGEDFDLDSIDKALDSVNAARSVIGAQTNGLDYTISHTSKASEQQAKALSSMTDTDYAKASIDFATSRILEEYAMFTQKNQMQTAGNLMNMLV